jgi:hypothetical protein
MFHWISYLPPFRLGDMAVDNSIKMTWTVTSGSIHTDRYLESENNTDIHKDELSYITSPYIRRREGEREK